MIFSRFLLVALAAVGVVAQSGTPEKRGMVKVNMDPRDYSPSPYKTAIAKLNEYQEQTSDVMAGPKSEREAKLIEITAGMLDAVKTYNNDFKNNFSLLDISNIAKSGEMSSIGSTMYRILRSCKGTRSQPLTDNIHAMNVEVDSMGDFLAQKLPSTLSAMVLPAFAKYSDRMDMIEYATKPATY
ncbi:unnamed protein product [Rhizoctonia solani]|uniref:Uncharacterized protein n=1 Tax=Rhizoctonia solani TaxID=456999 RepID=A0A8H3GZD9_9AGAM|nr:unnamed protein product [Rhizoctonia solani]